MPAPPARKRGQIHLGRIWRSIPFGFIPAFLLAGCASSPPPQNPVPPIHAPISSVPIPPIDAWDGTNGAIRDRGTLLADFALTLRGTPYRYGGATVEGFDCSGLVFFAHRRFGLLVPRTSREQAERAALVKRRKLERGDLVFFRIGSRNVNHVGIYIGDDQFVHAPGKGKPVTIDSLDDEYYEKRFESAGRYWNQSAR